jgi:hypothetical protein
MYEPIKLLELNTTAVILQNNSYPSADARCDLYFLIMQTIRASDDTCIRRYVHQGLETLSSPLSNSIAAKKPMNSIQGQTL